ncbi:MAG: hypothetical protein ACOYT8_05155 [Candidatus Dependentiae bacterium]
MKIVHYLFLALTVITIHSSENKYHQSDYEYAYKKVSREYLKLADYFANKAIDAYYQPDIDIAYIKELNKLRYQYHLLAIGLDPKHAANYNELVEVASLDTAIDFELFTDTLHGKTLIEHIAEKTQLLCRHNQDELCANAKKTHAAFKQYIQNVFEKIKRYESE